MEVTTSWLVIPEWAARAFALLAILVAGTFVAVGPVGPGGVPERELLFGFMSYVLGPAGVATASATLPRRGSSYMVPAALVGYLLGVVAFMFFAVAIGAIAP